MIGTAKKPIGKLSGTICGFLAAQAHAMLSKLDRFGVDREYLATVFDQLAANMSPKKHKPGEYHGSRYFDAEGRTEN